jgi:hypothetical protein
MIMIFEYADKAGKRGENSLMETDNRGLSIRFHMISSCWHMLCFRVAHFFTASGRVKG